MQETPSNTQESRVRKTLLNARVNLIFYFLSIILAFFSRKIFLDCLGAAFIGLTGTLQNLLGFLNLAELGIGSAIGYVLYKPIYEHDRQKINEIISVMGFLYRWIGLIILGSGIILSCFLPLIFPASDTGFSYALIYFAFYAFLSSSLIGYFINYRQNLLAADQRNYVVTAYFQSTVIIKILIQMAVAYYTGSYYAWVAIELAFGIIYSLILNYKINQTYPWLKSNIKSGKTLFKSYPEVMKYTRQLFVHQISTFAQFQISPILIYLFVSLQTVAYYGNYTLIIDKAGVFMSHIFGSANAGIGNLIAEGNSKKILSVYWEMMSSRFFFGGIIIFGLIVFLVPFISLWLGEQYILPDIVMYLLIFNFFISVTRGSDAFLFGNGLFYDVWAPIAETVIYIVTALIGGHFWGLPGVIFGNTLSLLLIVGIWKPAFLFRVGFKTPIWHYWLGWSKMCLIMAVSIAAIKYIMLNHIHLAMDSWGSIFVAAVVDTLIFTIFYFALFYCLSRPFRSFTTRFLKRRS